MNGVEIHKRELKIAFNYIDTYNPKIELNYLNVNRDYIFATNTRELFYMNHNSEVKDDFYVGKELIQFALKVRRADSFILLPNKIKIIDSNDEEIFTISEDKNTENFKMLKVESIINSKCKKEIPFTNGSQISGILALNKIVVREKCIPKDVDIEYYDYMYISINSLKEPIKITTNLFGIVIMPIVEKIPYFNGDDYDML